MSQSQLRSLRTYAFFLVLLGAVSLAGDSHAGQSTATIYEIPDEGQISLIIGALERAINDPSPCNLQFLSDVVKEEEKEPALQKIADLAGPKEEFASRFGFDVSQQAWIDPSSLVEQGGGFRVHSKVIFQINNLAYQETIPISLSKAGRLWKFDALSSYLDEVDRFLSESRLKVVADIAPAPHTPLKGSRDITDYTSENMLNSIYFYPEESISRYTTTASLNTFGCINFGEPYGILPVSYKLPLVSGVTFITHEFLIVTDPAWNRILASDVVRSWLTAVGMGGAGPYQFWHPMGVAFLPPDGYVVADAHNHRASVYRMTDHDEGDFAFVTLLQNNNGRVVDVAACRYSDGSRQVAVLDWTNCRVDLYDVTGEYSLSFRRSLFSQGSGIGQLLRPTSISFGKSWISQYNIPYLFIVDAGNNRIVRVDTSFTDIVTTDLDFGSNPFLTSVDAGYFGDIYVVDKYGCKIYQLEFGLDNLIGIYGSNGTGDKQLKYPSKFRTAEAWSVIEDDPDFNYYLVPCADAFVTEEFGAETGIRRYFIGCEVLWQEFTTNLIDSGGFIFLSLDWHQTGATRSIEKIHIRGGNKDTTIHSGGPYSYLLAGDNYLHLIPDDAPRLNGYYVFEVALLPPYEDVFVLDTTYVRDSIYIAYPQTPEQMDSDSCGGELGPQININWSDVDVTGTSYFELYRDDVLIATIPSSQSRWMDRDVVYGDYYTYKVRSRWGSDYMSEFSSTTTNTTSGFIPARPTNPHATFDNNRCTFTISYEDNSINEEYFYVHVLYQSSSGQPRQDHVYADADDTSAVYYTNEDGVTFAFYVYAVDALNCGVCDFEDPNGCRLYSDPASVCDGYSTHCYDPSCPFLHVWSGRGYEKENNLLAASLSRPDSSSDYLELHRISLPPAELHGIYRFQLIEGGWDASVFDRVSLITLDVASTGPLVMNDSAWLYSVARKITPTKVVDHRGIDVTRHVMEKDGSSYFCGEPGFLIAEFENLPFTLTSKIPEDGGAITDPPIKGQPGNMSKIASGNPPARRPSRLDIFAENNGEWVLINSKHGQAFNRDQLYFPCRRNIGENGTLKLKLEWNVAYRADEIAYAVTTRRPASIRIIPPVEAIHSSAGDVTGQLLTSNDQRVSLLPEDTISLAFVAPPSRIGTQRCFVLLLEGRYFPGQDSVVSRSAFAVDSSLLPGYFAFNQNYPNPFNPTTTFRFALPVASQVKLEIYNVLGQKAGTLLNDRFEAGYHSFRWDSGGLASGVYLARFKAGDFTASRKVVVLK
jgi:hypothetical protein